MLSLLPATADNIDSIYNSGKKLMAKRQNLRESCIS